MRWLALAGLAVLGAGCGGEPAECGTSVAEDIFIVTAIDAYNAALGPTASGMVWSCPGGGTATVMGTTTQQDATTRIDDFSVTYGDCFDSGIETTLVLTGVVHQHGTWILDVNASYCNDCTITSDALTIRGTESHCDEPHIDRTCNVRYTVTGTAANKPQRYDGTVCDFTFP